LFHYLFKHVTQNLVHLCLQQLAEQGTEPLLPDHCKSCYKNKHVYNRSRYQGKIMHSNMVLVPDHNKWHSCTSFNAVS